MWYIPGLCNALEYLHIFFIKTQFLGNTFSPLDVCILCFRELPQKSGCLVQTMPSSTWGRMSCNSPRLTTRPRWGDCSQEISILPFPEHWSFLNGVPCHGVSRLASLEQGHCQAGGGGGQGGLLIQLLVTQLLSAALWYWHGGCEEQVNCKSFRQKDHLFLLFCCSQVDVQYVASAWEIISTAPHQTQVGSLWCK